MKEQYLFAEQTVAGSILIDSKCLPAVRSVVKADDFNAPICAAIFRAACRLVDAGVIVDPVSIQADAAKYGDELTTEYLSRLMDITPTAANAAMYAERVREASVRRKIGTIGEYISNIAENEQVSTSEMLSEVMGKLESISTGVTSEVMSSADAAAAFLEYRENVAEKGGAVVPTGYQKLDAILGGGMVKEGLYIMAARPGIGKTTLAMKIADYVAKKKPVLFVSLEMSMEQLFARRISDRTGLQIGKVLLDAEITDEEQTKICTAAAEIAETKLHTNRTACATVADISAYARTIPDLSLIVIDYLGLIQAEDSKANIYQRTTDKSNALKRLARSIGVPVLCLAQLNREAEHRADNRPLISDLRDSGAIEQDADAVILLHRPLYNLPPNDPNKPKFWESEPLVVDVAKNRHGEAGRIELKLYGRCGRVRE